MNQRQLAEWRAFYDDCPWGEEVEDLRHGIRAAVIVNSQRAKGRAVKPQSYMIHTPPKPKQTWQDIKRIAKRAARMSGGKVIKANAKT